MRSRLSWAPVGLVVLCVASTSAAPLSAQVVTLGTPYLSGCAPGTGLGGPGQQAAGGVFALGEPRVGNAGFGVLGENLAAIGSPALVVGQCAGAALPAASYLPTCPALPGGCLLYIDPNGIYLGVPVFAVIPTYITPRPVWSLPVPNSPALVGQTLCVQGFAMDSWTPPGGTSNPYLCLRVSNGLSITVLP